MSSTDLANRPAPPAPCLLLALLESLSLFALEGLKMSVELYTLSVGLPNAPGLLSWPEGPVSVP
jgi:hypothetical protein